VRFGVALAWVLGVAGSAGAQDRPPTVVVMPFTTEGRSVDTTALQGGADRMVLELNKLLWADSTVRWLVYRSRQRPQDPRTGFVVAPLYSVIGAVRGGPEDSVWVRVQLVAVQTMDLVLRDSAPGRLGEEADRAPRIARRVVAALHAHARRPRAARADSVPEEAVTLVSRATLDADRGDTVSAVTALRQALIVAPRWTVPCAMLRKLRPSEPCP